MTVVTLLAVALMACGGDGTGPSSTPSVAGVWTGTWRGSAVLLTLSQSGSDVAGVMRIGSDSRPVSGRVATNGDLTFASEVNRSNCSGYGASGLRHDPAAATLTGIVRRSTGPRMCDPAAGGRTLVEQGQMALSR